MKNQKGLELHTRVWKPDIDAKALLFISHGFSEYAGVQVYNDLAHELIKDGILVFAHDHVGHGESEGDRVHIEDFQNYCHDVRQHVLEIKSKYPGLNVFAYAHSMGGTIVLRTVMMYADLFDGVISSSSAIDLGPSILPAKSVILAKALSWLYPQMIVAQGCGIPISRDKKLLTEREKDPLMWNGSRKARWTKSYIECMNFVKSNMTKFQIPILVLHGDADEICLARGSRFIYDHVSSADKTLKIYPGYFHNIIAEPESNRKTVVNDIREWIRDRINT